MQALRDPAVYIDVVSAYDCSICVQGPGQREREQRESRPALTETGAVKLRSLGTMTQEMPVLASCFGRLSNICNGRGTFRSDGWPLRNVTSSSLSCLLLWSTAIPL